MIALSNTNSPLPPLCSNALRLNPASVSSLENALIPGISGTVSGHFWGLITKVRRIMNLLPVVGNLGAETQTERAQILGDVESIMHEMVALSEYLGRVGVALMPSPGKKNPATQQLLKTLEYQVDKLFKVPVNFIKHQSFRLQWMQMTADDEVTAGFVVSGKVAPGVTGPASFKTDQISEGYSFALFLRLVVPTIFCLCATLDDAIANLYGTACSTSSNPAPDPQLTVLSQLADRMVFLPTRGFPSERNDRVSQ